MKRLRDFAYLEPSSLDEAAGALAEHGVGARLLAGGTDLIVDMKTGRDRPGAIVNLKAIPGLRGVKVVDGGIRIGALTTAAAIQGSVLVMGRHPALHQAASALAPPPVRVLATIGGNVGRASPASDLGPALIAASASALIHGVDGSRTEPVETLYCGPGLTTLAVSDIITAFFLPDPPQGHGSAHLKVGKRGSGTDIALAGVAVGVSVDFDGAIADARVVLSSLGPKPMRSAGAEAALVGRRPERRTIEEAGRAAAADASPITDMRATSGYRTRLAGSLTQRALRAALKSAGEEAGS